MREVESFELIVVVVPVQLVNVSTPKYQGFGPDMETVGD